MQIRELNIDGFGVFSDKQVTGLTDGLNVIYGENEAGKTTLIEFIRRMFFGAARKSKGYNLYSPLNGGRHGGRLKCQSASKETFQVSRTFSGKEDIDISPAVAGFTGQAALTSILDNASANIFQNIFAFTLDELQSFNSLEEGEIKNRIYGAELGLGTVSLKEVEESIDKPAKEIFLPKGKKTQTHLLLKEIQRIEQEIQTIQTQVQEYDRLTRQWETCKKEQRPRQEKIDSLEVEKRNLETRKELYPVVREMHDIEADINKTGEVVEIPSSGLKTLDAWVEERKSLLLRLDEEESQVNAIRIEQGSLSVNHDLLGHEADIIHLQQSIQSINSSLKDSGTLEQEKTVLEKEIQADLQEIGDPWDREKVLNFTEFNRDKISEIESFLKAFESHRLDVTKARDRLENHQEQRVREQSKGWNLPSWLKAIASGFTGLGLVGLIWGGLEMNVPLLVVSLVVTVFGLFFFWKMVADKKGFARVDHLENSLKEKLSQTEVAEDQKKSEWRTWLKAMAFAETLEPLGAQEFANALKEIKRKFLNKTDIERRMADMQAFLSGITHRIEKIKPCLPDTCFEGSVSANIEIISRMFAEAKENLIGKNRTEKLVQQQVYKIDKLKSQLREVETSLKEMVQKAGAEDEADYREKFDLFIKRNSLLEQAERKRSMIQMRVGGGSRYEQFLKEIDSKSPDEIMDELNQVAHRLDAVQQEKSHVDQTIGAIRNQLDQVASNDEMLIKQGELEVKKQKLREAVKQWATAKIALAMLDSAKKEYEKTRQPGVLKSAESVFAEITAGKYLRIVKPLDEDEIFIQNTHGVQTKVSETSRGTREQLYLCMRLGLIEEYESRSEPLPLVMDDVLVNFDDSRKVKVIETLTRFSKSRQIIVLTCHKASLDAYLKAGATRIRI